jgi:uncharacterized repeat protein (TIGR01451 family)
VALRTANIFSYLSQRLTRVVLLFLNAFKASFNITAIGQISGRILAFWLIAALVSLPVTPAMADLRSAPVWYDQNAVTTTPDWHYRVPINVPAGAAINATIKVDVDFTTLMTTLGISGAFDVNSPRIVRSNGTLSTRQEFTDTVYAGATDAVGNAKGEVRFLLEDTGAVTYYLYFDITQNGTKPVNPQVPINGNFEFVGTATPPGWTTSSKVNAAFDTQIRASESLAITTDGATLNNPFTTDGTPKTGAQSYLLGARTNNEPVSNKNATLLDRAIIVPAGAAAGNLVVRWRPEGWDSDINGGANGFDHFKVSVVTSGGIVTQIVGPTAGNYATNPFAPTYGTAAITATTPGYGAYNSWDMGTNGTPHAQGMTVGYNTQPWWTISYSLAAFAGQTVTLRFETGHVLTYRSWASIDDIEWSVVTASLGSPQSFGVNITSPAPSSTYVPGQAIPITVQVDANPTAGTNPVTVAIVDSSGAIIVSGFILYNDGTHGDVTAGDAIWSNNNSIPAQPAPTIPLSSANGSGYQLRVYGKDASTSIIGAQNGLVRGPGTGAAAEIQSNYWNIDDQLFTVAGASISLAKTSAVLSDPTNGLTNPKAIPGAIVRYCITVANAGPVAATSVAITDPLPASITYTAGTMKSGASCATATTVEDDDNSGADEGDPVGASFTATILTIVQTSLATSGVIALIFDATVN